jgi:hypothetical protein
MCEKADQPTTGTRSEAEGGAIPLPDNQKSSGDHLPDGRVMSVHQI